MIVGSAAGGLRAETPIRGTRRGTTTPPAASSYRRTLFLRRHFRKRVYATIWLGWFAGTITARNARDAEQQMRENGSPSTGIGFMWEEV